MPHLIIHSVSASATNSSFKKDLKVKKVILFVENRFYEISAYGIIIYLSVCQSCYYLYLVYLISSRVLELFLLE